MGVVGKTSSILVFLTMLAVGISVALPAEDVLDSVYDEMEALPFETAPAFMNAAGGESIPAHQPMQPRSAHIRNRESLFSAGQVAAPSRTSASPIVLDHCFRC